VEITDFASYETFLHERTAALIDNLSDAARAHRYAPIGTLSTGYDSTAVMAVLSAHGLRDAISFTSARSGDTEDVWPIAEALEVDVHRYDRDAWRAGAFPEVSFIAGDGGGGDVFMYAAREALQGTVLFSGHAGGAFWNKHPDIPSGNFFLRGRTDSTDVSGLSLTEFRLRAGFIHCPFPQLGGHILPDVSVLSHADEMRPWDIGGDYNRPLARRLAEEAGVPREAFGQTKNAASVLLFKREEFLTPASWESFLVWSRQHRWHWLRRGVLPPSEGSHRVICATQRLAAVASTWLRGRGARKLQWYARREFTFRFLFPWALEKAKERYAMRAGGMFANHTEDMYARSGKSAI
jgi:hypothetical protein